jgi:hypothetical protein
MATKKQTGRYLVLRDFAEYTAGQIIDVDDDAAALLIRDGMIAPAEEG